MNHDDARNIRFQKRRVSRKNGPRVLSCQINRSPVSVQRLDEANGCRKVPHAPAVDGSTEQIMGTFHIIRRGFCASTGCRQFREPRRYISPPVRRRFSLATSIPGPIRWLPGPKCAQDDRQEPVMAAMKPRSAVRFPNGFCLCRIGFPLPARKAPGPENVVKAHAAKLAQVRAFPGVKRTFLWQLDFRHWDKFLGRPVYCARVQWNIRVVRENSQLLWRNRMNRFSEWARYEIDLAISVLVADHF